MKKLALIITLVFGITIAHAQDQSNNDQINTIFTKQKSNGGYGALSLGYTQFEGRDAFIAGGRGAFIFDHSLAIGLGGYGFVNNLDYHSVFKESQFDYLLAGGYGGIFIEPIIGGKNPVHLSFPVLFGFGAVTLADDYGIYEWEHFDPFYGLDHDLFFVIEPAVEAEFNLTRFFRAAVYVSYRHTSNIDLYETNNDVLRGLNFGVTFKFGKF